MDVVSWDIRYAIALARPEEEVGVHAGAHAVLVEALVEALEVLARVLAAPARAAVLDVVVEVLHAKTRIVQKETEEVAAADLLHERQDEAVHQNVAPQSAILARVLQQEMEEAEVRVVVRHL